MSEARYGFVNTSWISTLSSQLYPRLALVLVPTLVLDYLGTAGAVGVEGALGGICGTVGEAK